MANESGWCTGLSSHHASPAPKLVASQLASGVACGGGCGAANRRFAWAVKARQRHANVTSDFHHCPSSCHTSLVALFVSLHIVVTALPGNFLAFVWWLPPGKPCPLLLAPLVFLASFSICLTVALGSHPTFHSLM